MQYNTALCFLALGFGGLTVSPRRQAPLLLAGGVAAVMGAAVLFEYGSALSLGIDTLLFYPWVTSLSAYPGRMALTTALSFCLTGTSLVVLALRKNSYASFGILNSITVSLALTSLIGYCFGVTYVLPFNLGSQMALHTSAAFFVYGVALLGYAWRHAEQDANGLPRWSAGIGVALLPVLLVGASALFSEQSWRVLPLQALVAVAAVAVISVAIRRLVTARVAYKGLLMMVIPLILLLVFVGLVMHVKRQSESAQRMTLHSVEVITRAESLLKLIAETESAVRGYTIAEDEVFVKATDQSLAEIALVSAQLQALVEDNPVQTAHVFKIEALIKLRTAQFTEIFRLIKGGNKTPSQADVRGQTGPELMRQIVAETTAFTDEEKRLGSERRQLLDQSWLRLSWLLVSGTASAILLASILTLMFSGSISRRLKALRDNASNLAAGKTLAPPLSGSDEIAELDRVFHAMAESLANVARQEKADRDLQDQSQDVRHTEALLKTGPLQSAIFNSANFSSIATDAKGVIQIFNVGAERMLGYAAADVLNTITPADISDPQEVVARAKALSIELGTPITPGFEALVFKASRGIEDIYELTYIRKDGSRFPAVVSVTALRDPLGAIIGYLLIGTDNTARKQAEAALVKAGALQSAIFNSANFSSIATDEKGVIQIFNVGAERMLGYAAADVMNKITPADISDPQEVIARAKELSLELATPITPGFEALVFKASRGIEDIYELTYIRKDGSRLPAVVSVTALRAEGGGIIGYLLIGTDNTARKQVEEERKKLDQRLRDQQFYTRSLIESNTDAIITTDPLGIITDVNKQMEALTGSTRDELIGAPFKSCFTDPERAEAGIKLVLSDKKVADYELTARARDGTETVVSYNATTFYDRERRLQGVFAAARDITERKRTEHALQISNREMESAKSAAEKANLAKSDFLSSMSHELRSPLNAILGFAQLMESATPVPTTTQAGRITQILQAGWHLLNLINEILDLAAVESGKVSLSLEPVSLIEVMGECHTMMEPQAQARGIQMHFPRLELPTYVWSDRTRLKQVVINLLSNAIKYNKEQGSVSVSCVVVASGRTRISIEDTGEGLVPEKVAQLFQPFNRLGQEGRGITGTGIGLVVTKQLVELMDGTIGVESDASRGSTFWIELRTMEGPELSSPIEAREKIQTPRPFGERMHTLLYIEDNPANLMLVEQIVARRTDIQLLSAVTGIIGIELARTALPDVILMDINLPGISGIEAMKRLRMDPRTAHIPVVALSANAMVRDVRLGMEVGFFRYLTKPINMVEFMKTLDVALEFAAEHPAGSIKVEAMP